jgi:anti-anti-sigma regulatory factor
METIVVDLHSCNEISPKFFRSLVALRYQADSTNYRIHLVGVTKEMGRALEKTGLGRFFTYDLID